MRELFSPDFHAATKIAQVTRIEEKKWVTPAVRPPGLRGRDGSPQPSDFFARPVPVGAKKWVTPAVRPYRVCMVGTARRSRPTSSLGPRQPARKNGSPRRCAPTGFAR